MKEKRTFFWKFGLFLINIVILVSLLSVSSAYYVLEFEEMHQHLTQQSAEVWPFIPKEIENRSTGNVNDTYSFFGGDYNNGDNIIIGSAEEDIPLRFGSHGWLPDKPNTLSIGTDDYNAGWVFLLPPPFQIRHRESLYRKALNLLRENFIKKYRNGDIDEAYYWLGRIVHLLEDASQPAHVHLDVHGHALTGGVSYLEGYTGNRTIYQQYDGSTYYGKEYQYENLIPGFANWNKVQPYNADSGKNYLPFFKFF